MSNKIKTLTVYDEFEDLPEVDRDKPDTELLALMLPDLSNINAISVEDTFDICLGDEFFEFNFDNQETPLIDALEAEYGKPMRELSTDCAIYWLVARAMSNGIKEDAIWMRDDTTLVWC